MSYRKIKKHIEKLNQRGLTILFYPPTKAEESSIYFDIADHGVGTGDGWLVFTPDMLTRNGCRMANKWIRKMKITDQTQRDFCRMFYSLDETYQMPNKVVQ